MRLMSLLAVGSPASTARRRRRAFTSSMSPTLEGLESRLVLAVGPVAAQVAPAAVAQQLLQLTNITVTNLQVVGDNLLATVDVAGTLAGRAFQLNDIQVPITATLLQPPGNQECPILHLEIEIEDLNVLGLHVELNNCREGPVTIDVTAKRGGLLGDLLCGLTGTGSQLTGLLGGLTNILNQTLGQLLGGNNGGQGGGPGGNNGNSQQNQPGRCDLVNLDTGPINLNVLGLQVKTSRICLDVYGVESGFPGGGLVGSLLCSLNDLLQGGAPLRVCPITELVDG